MGTEKFKSEKEEALVPSVQGGVSQGEEADG